MNRLLSMVALAMLAMAAWAAKPSNILTTEPVQKPAAAVRSLDIVILPSDPAASPRPEFYVAKEDLAAALTSKLRKRTDLAVNVRDAAADDVDAILTIQITHLNFVSAGKQWTSGLVPGSRAAGRASLETSVKLTDRRDARTLWSASTDAKAGRTTFSGNSTTQIESLSGQLATELLRILEP